MGTFNDRSLIPLIARTQATKAPLSLRRIATLSLTLLLRRSPSRLFEDERRVPALQSNVHQIERYKR
jgi:hypothetical protein